MFIYIYIIYSIYLSMYNSIAAKYSWEDWFSFKNKTLM